MVAAARGATVAMRSVKSMALIAIETGVAGTADTAGSVRLLAIEARDFFAHFAHRLIDDARISFANFKDALAQRRFELGNAGIDVSHESSPRRPRPRRRPGQQAFQLRVRPPF